MLEVYGIPNCDTVKKATKWLIKHRVPFHFYDFHTKKVGKQKIDQWITKAGLEIVLNRKSTTWRNLPLALQESVLSNKNAAGIISKHLTIIKRPVIVSGEEITIGFSEVLFEKYLE